MNTTVLSLARASYSTVKAGLALVGAAALAAVLVLPWPREHYWKELPPLALLSLGEPFGTGTTAGATAAGPIQTGVVDDPLAREQRAVTEYVARRYRVSEQAVAGFVGSAYRAGAERGVDPLLVLAVISVESRFNPIAESVMGAKGLMQIIPKYHKGKLELHGGEDAVLDPESNILVGSRILQEYVRRSGTLEGGLQLYNGAGRDITALYAQKVLAERARLERVMRGTFITALDSQGG
jgi:soluble lytic murein transglycosylase-like protein